MTQPKVAVRLGTEGKAEAQRDFREYADAGDAAANRVARAFDRASQDMESAQRRQAAAADKLAAIMPQTATQMRISETVGTGSSMQEGSARVSAAAFREAMAAQEEYERGAQRLRATLDPTFAAQQRFNSEMAQARTLIANGAISLDEYCAKLRMEQTALNQTGVAHEDGIDRTARLRFAYQSLGYQIQDIGASLSTVSGPSGLFRIFAQQGGQVFDALNQIAQAGGNASKGTKEVGEASGEAGSDLNELGEKAIGVAERVENTGTRFGRFAAFMSGPWGAALMVGMSVLGPLVSKLFESGEASEAAEKAAEAHRDSIEALNKAMRTSILTAQDRARTSYVEAESERLSAIETRNKTQAMLEQAKVRAQNAQGSWIGANGPNGAQSVVANQYATEVERLERALVENQAAIKAQTATANIAQDQYIAQILRDMRTPEGRVNERYNQQINAVIKAGGDADKQAGAIKRLETARAAELKIIDDQAEALRKSGNARRDGDTATTAQVSKLLLEAFGGTITSTTGGKHVKGSYHYKSQAVDFVPSGGMGSISKEQIRSIAEGAGLQIKELLGPGDKNHSDHFHLAWAGGKGQMDSARIVGQMMAEEVRKSLAMEKQRNDWVNDQSLKVGEKAKAAFDAEGKRLAENRDDVASLRADTSGGTALLNLEWQLRTRSRDVIADTLELERYRQDIISRYPSLTREQIEEQVKAQRSQIEMNRMLEDFGRNWQEVTDFGRNFVDTVLSPDAWSSWGNLGKTILRELQAEMLKLALLNPIKNALFGDGLPTLTSAFGTLFGRSGSALAAPTGTYNAAIGSEYTTAGSIWVGENGPERVEMPRGSKIMTAGESRRMAEAAANDRGETHVHVYADNALVTQQIVSMISQGMDVASVRGASGGAAMSDAQAVGRARRQLGRRW